MTMKRCWKYSWKFCKHDGPCETCDLEILAKRVKNSGKLMDQVSNDHRNAINNLEKARIAVERAKKNIEDMKAKIGARCAFFYQVENEPEVEAENEQPNGETDKKS